MTMILDFVGCWAIEKVCKFLWADLEPKAMVTRGRERRERRRLEEETERLKQIIAEKSQ
jgi:cation-transporting ATPase 13A1